MFRSVESHLWMFTESNRSLASLVEDEIAFDVGKTQILGWMKSPTTPSSVLLLIKTCAPTNDKRDEVAAVARRALTIGGFFLFFFLSEPSSHDEIWQLREEKEKTKKQKSMRTRQKLRNEARNLSATFWQTSMGGGGGRLKSGK